MHRKSPLNGPLLFPEAKFAVSICSSLHYCGDHKWCHQVPRASHYILQSCKIRWSRFLVTRIRSSLWASLLLFQGKALFWEHAHVCFKLEMETMLKVWYALSSAPELLRIPCINEEMKGQRNSSSESRVMKGEESKCCDSSEMYPGSFSESLRTVS